MTKSINDDVDEVPAPSINDFHKKNVVIFNDDFFFKKDKDASVPVIPFDVSEKVLNQVIEKYNKSAVIVFLKQQHLWKVPEEFISIDFRYFSTFEETVISIIRTLRGLKVELFPIRNIRTFRINKDLSSKIKSENCKYFGSHDYAGAGITPDKVASFDDFERTIKDEDSWI